MVSVRLSTCAALVAGAFSFAAGAATLSIDASAPNPAPLKAALSMRGLMRDELRLPMTPATGECRSRLAAALEALEAV